MRGHSRTANWQRLTDYERRAIQDPPRKLSRAAVPSEYLEVHPFGDDAVALRSARLHPAQCTSVDLYWRIGDDVVFVQASAREVGLRWQPGVHVRWNSWQPPTLVLQLRVDVPFLRRSDVEKQLRALLPRLRSGMADLDSRVGKRPVLLEAVLA